MRENLWLYFNGRAGVRKLLNISFFLLLFLFFTASPARANTCPVFSQPGGIDSTQQVINITYGNCPKTPVTITFNTGTVGGSSTP